MCSPNRCQKRNRSPTHLPTHRCTRTRTHARTHTHTHTHTHAHTHTHTRARAHTHTHTHLVFHWLQFVHCLLQLDVFLLQLIQPILHSLVFFLRLALPLRLVDTGVQFRDGAHLLMKWDHTRRLPHSANVLPATHQHLHTGINKPPQSMPDKTLRRGHLGELPPHQAFSVRVVAVQAGPGAFVGS